MTITKEEVQKLLDRMTFECVNCEMDHALAEDIGKTLIAESARADQAEAAMAAMVERCAEAVTPQDVYGDGRYFRVPGFHQAGCAYKDNDLVAAANIAVERIRALASPSGLAMLAELRAESEARHQLHLEQVRITKEWIAERDTLAAANAALEAKVAGLVEALRNLVGPDCMYDGRNIVITAVNHGDAIRLVAEARAALATQEAGT